MFPGMEDIARVLQRGSQAEVAVPCDMIVAMAMTPR